MRSGPGKGLSTRDDLDSADAVRRRNRAIELGRGGDLRSVERLIRLLECELDDRVRASAVLALGALGGDLAKSAVTGLTPQGPAEAKALAKALDRLAGEMRLDIGWKPGLTLSDIHFEVPVGLEHPLSRRLIQDGLGETEPVRPGLLRILQPLPVERLDALPRYVYNLRLPLAVAEPDLADGVALARLIGRAARARPWRAWLESLAHGDRERLPYRLLVEGRDLPRAVLRNWLDKVRTAFAPVGMVDSPSAYSFEIIASWLGHRPSLFFRPRFADDRRFAYRERDVAASIHPVVAAALARLIPDSLPGTVVDPTCGSATLLIERGLISSDSALVGIDVSAAALAAARTNLDAAGLSDCTSLVRSDAREGAIWPDCGIVLANLPFGIRSGRDDPDLGQLYRAILENAEARLSETGRVLLASANRGALERAVAASRLRLLARYRVLSGGLHVHVVVFGHGSTPSARQHRHRKPRQPPAP